MTFALAWAWGVKHWRIAVMVAATAVVLGLWAYADHLKHAASAQKAKAQQAVHQAQIQTVATKAVDRVAVVTHSVEEHTHVVVRTIQAAPGADTPVPAAILSAWHDGLSDDADPPN